MCCISVHTFSIGNINRVFTKLQDLNPSVFDELGVYPPHSPSVLELSSSLFQVPVPKANIPQRELWQMKKRQLLTFGTNSCILAQILVSWVSDGLKLDRAHEYILPV